MQSFQIFRNLRIQLPVAKMTPQKFRMWDVIHVAQFNELLNRCHRGEDYGLQKLRFPNECDHETLFRHLFISIQITEKIKKQKNQHILSNSMPTTTHDPLLYFFSSTSPSSRPNDRLPQTRPFPPSGRRKFLVV